MKSLALSQVVIGTCDESDLQPRVKYSR